MDSPAPADEDALFEIRHREILSAVRGSDPESFVMAVFEALRPAMEHLSLRREGIDAERVRWILMELVANAVNARLGLELSARTGLGRGEILAAFGTSVPWPNRKEGELAPHPADGAVVAIESAVGCEPARFLALPLVEKFRALGLLDAPGWVTVRVRTPGPDGAFDLQVRSAFPPGPEDRAIIERVFADRAAARSEVQRLRKAHEGKEGMYHIPSFTGGGGAGLLASLAEAERLGLRLAYSFDEGALFTLSRP